jgi:hypothetical protein
MARNFIFIFNFCAKFRTKEKGWFDCLWQFHSFSNSPPPLEKSNIAFIFPNKTSPCFVIIAYLSEFFEEKKNFGVKS